MKAVMPTLLPDVAALRKRTGADRWDEIWEGVLHMPPAPNPCHQKLEWELETWLEFQWARPRGNRVYHQINLAPPGGWPDRNYRIPDLVLLTPDRFHIDRDDYFEGPPTAVVEIHSPGDEAYGKLSFYAELGVPEAWIIDRDTRRPEVYVLREGGYVPVSADADGWIHGPATGVELQAVTPGRHAPDGSAPAPLQEEHSQSAGLLDKSPSAGRLALRIAGDDETRQEIPQQQTGGKQ